MSFYRIVLLLLSSAALQTHARQLSIPEYEANPGGVVDIPVYLDNAFGLSSVEVQVNYDTAILTLQSVSAGSLGLLFEEMVHEVDDGIITMFFVSSENFLVGSGNLAVMRFEMREGAEDGLFGEIAIASYRYSDSSGVIALHRKEALDSQFGKVTASNDPMIDNAGNGLPDWWEREYGLDLFRPNAADFDSDGDGLVEILEFGLVGNPNLPDAGSVSPTPSQFEDVDSSIFTTLTFRRRTGTNAPNYTLIESSDLAGWWNLDLESQILHSIDHSDGTETIEVKGSLDLNDSEFSRRGFLRLEID